jgi:hypothetical protein|tara:strand:+ start:26304 stop:26684 length:381 start_codon:yes stop_codon:yes gene_type:complete
MFNDDILEIGILYEKMCWDGYEKRGTKIKDGKTVNNCVEVKEDEEIPEEDAEQCTKTTKKASSDRKGKKWTKCAKQTDGSVKRIHWGQAGVRVGKDNPKRRNSFRKRHNCKDAKPGTPNAASCNDW